MIAASTFDLESPDDASGLDAAVAAIGPANIVKLAVFAKVAGDYDDGARERARGALEQCIAARGLQDRTQILTAVGCEGVATPFGHALAEIDGPAGAEPRLAMGFARSGEPPDDELDRPALAARVAETVLSAARGAGLAPADVVMVFVKVPAPQAARPGGEKVRGRRARGLAALGAGVALGDVAIGAVTDAAVAADASLYCPRAQTFAGPEVARVEAIVLGNRPWAGGDLVARAALVGDLIDVRSVKRVLMSAGLALDPDGELAAPDRVAACFVKAGVADDGRVRGAPTTIHRSTIAPERHMRAALSGAFGAMLGTTRVFITGDPVHAAPAGGGVACVLVRAPGTR
jgi:ring-opening amidohydrolase-like protein